MCYPRCGPYSLKNCVWCTLITFSQFVYALSNPLNCNQNTSCSAPLNILEFALRLNYVPKRPWNFMKFQNYDSVLESTWIQGLKLCSFPVSIYKTVKHMASIMKICSIYILYKFRKQRKLCTEQLAISCCKRIVEVVASKAYCYFGVVFTVKCYLLFRVKTNHHFI